jgi:hypothetical protein
LPSRQPVRNAPSVDGIRGLVDRPDPAIQSFLAEPWVLAWLERIFDAEPAQRGAASRPARARQGGAR